MTKEARCGLPRELMFADDLVLMVTTTDELKKQLVEGLTVNTRKTNLMVGAGGGRVVS